MTNGMIEEVLLQEDGTDIYPWRIFQKNVQKIIKRWSTLSTNMEVNSLASLQTLLGPAVEPIFKTSLCAAIQENALYYLTTYVEKQHLSQEDFLRLAPMTLISTYSTPVPLPQECATASGEKTCPTEINLKAVTPGENPWESSDESTGSIQSYISFYKNGETKKYGLKEKPMDSKIILTVYDLNNCGRDYDLFWKGTTMKLDMQFSNDPDCSKMYRMVEALKKQAHLELAERGAKLLMEEEKKESGKSFKRKWRN